MPGPTPPAEPSSGQPSRAVPAPAAPPPAAPPSTGRGLPGPVLVVLAAVCWGTGGLAGSVAGRLTGLSPVAVGSYRLLVAAVVLVLAVAARGRLGQLSSTVAGLLRRRADAARVVGVGVGLALFQVCYFLAVQAVGLSVATLLTLGLAPVLVTLGAALLLGERVGLRLGFALPVALVGLGLLVVTAADGTPGAGGATGGAGTGGVVVGTALACVSAAGYAAVTLLGRSLSGRVRPADVTTVGFVVGALVALPFGLVAGMALEPRVPSLALVLYLGVVPTALAYGLFFAGLRGTASGTASVLTLVEPLTATVLAVVLLDERLAAPQWLGAVLLCAAVLVLSLRQPPRLPSPA